MRLENIRRNQEAMREFQLPEATAAVATPRDRKKRSAPTPGVQREKRVKNIENLPRRTSNRLLKLEPDGPQAKEKHEKFTETFQSVDRKRQTRRAGDLSLSDASSGHGDVARFGQLLQEMATYVPESARVIDPEDMSDPEDEPSSVKEESKDHTIKKEAKEAKDTKDTKDTKGDNDKAVKKEEDGEDEDKKTGIRKYFSRATRASADTAKASHPTATTATPSKTKSTKDPSLRKKVQALQIKGPWPTVKVCQGRIYCMAIHENKDKILVCGGDIDGNLGFWDLDETLDENYEPDYDEEPNIYSYKAHTRTLSSMQYSPTDPTKLFTSSYDGSIRYLDLGKQQFIESYVVSPDASDHLGSVSLTSSGQQLWFADDEGGVTLKDVRTPKDEMVFRKLLHDKKVGCVNVNPAYDNLIVTSSLDRTMKIWDIRTFGKVQEDEPIQHLAEFPHGLSVTSAMWSPDGASIASTSYDDNVRIFNNFKPSLPDLSEIPDPVRIRHNNNSGRWVTMLRAVWSFQFNWFSIGNMNKSVDIFSRGTGDLMANLRDPQNLTTVPAVNAWHPNRVLLASGMANGKMVIWR
ncbi:hypothetical protein BGZ70_004648 [Mortierella alpina]|uniref:DNA damage-binding protein CMR1 n=1 Tax=Mortierella alpina TaxID=64518 RepID=A0A9P6ISD2_MORAP|nr:hypothetical protein BGZ70_004648 [Mortierella alpina]